MTTTETRPDVLTVEEVAAMLRISAATVRTMAQDGALESFKIGPNWRFRRDVVDAYTRNDTKK